MRFAWSGRAGAVGAVGDEAAFAAAPLAAEGARGSFVAAWRASLGARGAKVVATRASVEADVAGAVVVEVLDPYAAAYSAAIAGAIGGLLGAVGSRCIAPVSLSAPTSRARDASATLRGSDVAVAAADVFAVVLW